jgi:hypothetical protein
MSEMRPQTPAEMPQQLRFTARVPILDEALAAFEPEEFRLSEEFPQQLFLFAMKGLRIPTVDTGDGPEVDNLHRSRLMQYRQATDKISGNGKREFPLVSGVRELRDGGINGELVGVAMRVLLDDISTGVLISPPLYGPIDSRRPTNTLGAQLYGNSVRTMEKVRASQMLQVRYEFQRRGGDHDTALSQLRTVLDMGVRVSQLAVVPVAPKSARFRDIFQEGKIDRLFGPVSDEEIEEAPEAPDNITPINPDAPDTPPNEKRVS